MAIIEVDYLIAAVGTDIFLFFKASPIFLSFWNVHF